MDAIAYRPSPIAALFPVQPLDLLDVVRHRVVLAHALQLRPRVVLRAADEVEAAWAVALDVAFGRLLVVRVELEQRRVVRLLLGLLGRGRRSVELCLEVVLLGGHSRVSSRSSPS